MKIQIISVGKISTHMSPIADHYQKMISWPLKNTELSYSKNLSGDEAKQYEAKIIKDKITKGAYVIVLDLSGKQLDSIKFSSIFRKNMMEGKNIDFIIGGAFGLDKSILDVCHYKLCLSDMTFPHQLAKILLMEQIYRAGTILNNHPYHK